MGLRRRKAQKHVKVGYPIFFDYVANREVKVVYCPIMEMVAEIMTKPVGPQMSLYLKRVAPMKVATFELEKQ